MPKNTQAAKKPALLTRSYCCLLAANFLLYFGFWLLIPLLPFYLKEVHRLDEGQIGVILSCYTAAALLVRPFSAYLLDTFSRKPLYILAYTLFTTLFLGYILTSLLVVFIILRVIHGLAFGAVTLGGNTLVVDVMPSPRRGEGLGYYGLANNIAMSLGPMTGLLLHSAGLPFTQIFLIAFTVCAIGLLLACCVHAPKKERRSSPALSMDRFVLPAGLHASFSLLLLSIPYGATTNFVAMYVEQIGLNVVPGIFFVLLAIGMGVSRIFSGKYVDKGYITECIHVGFYPVVVAFLLLGFCSSIAAHHAAWANAAFVLVPILQGIGFGIMFPAYNSLYINLAPNNRRATATSTYLTAWDLGIGIGIIVSGAIAQYFGFNTVYLVGAALCALSMSYFSLFVTPHYKSHKLR